MKQFIYFLKFHVKGHNRTSKFGKKFYVGEFNNLINKKHHNEYPIDNIELEMKNARKMQIKKEMSSEESTYWKDLGDYIKDFFDKPNIKNVKQTLKNGSIGQQAAAKIIIKNFDYYKDEILKDPIKYENLSQKYTIQKKLFNEAKKELMEDKDINNLNVGDWVISTKNLFHQIIEINGIRKYSPGIDLMPSKEINKNIVGVNDVEENL